MRPGGVQADVASDSGGEAGRVSHRGRLGRAARAGDVPPPFASASVLPEGSGRRRGRRGRRSEGGGSIRSMWQSGRRMRPACGARASRARSSGSASRLSTCARPSRMSSAGASRSSQPDPPGSRVARDAAARRPRRRRCRPAGNAEPPGLHGRNQCREPRQQPPQPYPGGQDDRGRVPLLRQADRQPPAQQVDGDREAGGKARCGERGGHEQNRNTTIARWQAISFAQCSPRLVQVWMTGSRLRSSR